VGGYGEREDYRRGRRSWGEMTQTLYAYMNKRNFLKKEYMETISFTITTIKSNT
jgi:hypothetical protein